MDKRNKRIYTIGYSGFILDDFISALRNMNIHIVIDVRSTPSSKYFSDFNKGVLEKKLSSNHIHYRNYAVEFGARQNNANYYSIDGYLDFEKFVLSPQFINGFEKVKKGIEAGYNFALMCAEKKPNMCHRAIMIAREFSKVGYDVIHIMPNNAYITQKDIENEMLELYYPNSSQLSLLEDMLSQEEMINASYRKRNAEIGFRNEEED